MGTAGGWPGTGRTCAWCAEAEEAEVLADTMLSAGDPERGFDVAFDAERECRKKLYGDCPDDAESGVEGYEGDAPSCPAEMESPLVGKVMNSGLDGCGYGGECIKEPLGVCGLDTDWVEREEG